MTVSRFLRWLGTLSTAQALAVWLAVYAEGVEKCPPPPEGHP